MISGVAVKPKDSWTGMFKYLHLLLIDTDDLTGRESVWLSFTNTLGEQFRLGVSPISWSTGKARILIYKEGSDISQGIYPPSSIVVASKDDLTEWTANALVSWAYFPPSLDHLQVQHYHFISGETEPQVYVLCPGVLDADWKGCQTDARMWTNRDYNSGYSDIWTDAIGASGTNGALAKTLDILLFSASLAWFWLCSCHLESFWINNLCSYLNGLLFLRIIQIVTPFVLRSLNHSKVLKSISDSSNQTGISDTKSEFFHYDCYWA